MEGSSAASVSWRIVLAALLTIGVTAATATAAVTDTLTVPYVLNFNTDPPPTAASRAVVQVVAPDSHAAGIELDTFGAGQQGLVLCQTAEGTKAAPAAVVNNNLLCSQQAWGYDGTSYGAHPGGSSAFRAARDWTPTSHPTWYKVELTHEGSTENFMPFYITTEGHIGHMGSPPSLTGCGSSTVAGDDNGGRISIASALLSCTLVFAWPWQYSDGRANVSPVCFAEDETSGTFVGVSGVSGTQITLSGALNSGDKIVYHCEQIGT